MGEVVVVRKWGNSVGVILPVGLVEEKKINVNDKIVLDVKKMVSLKELFGSFKSKKSTQQLKSELKSEWF